MKLMHIADVHLDAPFRWLGSRGHEQRGQLKETFRTVVDLALSERVDALLVAGDLFDSNSPAQDTIDLVRSQLARLQAPVVLLPGTHDCLTANAIYRRADLRLTGGPPIHILDEGHTAFTLGPLLTIHGNANQTKTSPVSPLSGLAKNPDSRFNVALAHGSLAMPGAEDDFPITPGEIRGSQMDYIALGHWHPYRDCSAGTKACYSGPPELLSKGELGCVIIVELGDAGTVVRRLPVGKRQYERLDIPLDQVQTIEEIRDQVRRQRDPDLVLDVVLAGLRSLDLVTDPEGLAKECADGFFALTVRDSSHPTLSPELIATLAEKTVAGQFARLMSEKIGVATQAEDRGIAEAALQLGLALLKGRRVLQ